MSRMARQRARVWGSRRGKGRDQRAHARGDADGRVEDVVDHQRRGGEQAGVRAEVLRRDGVAAAAVGVGVDGLAGRRRRRWPAGR